ncbi:hypothetical protein [Metabacillus malikii]|uniref:Lipoprotein n=1 Tax=Metabacillus malikii TaxID=1504265 RepID=A0ABT9ZI55_9BACI|nr:hypothetical protein [Metabacillus malikii]MDQ0231660.1 hypothetical protein [Metabacillus malikii]
MRKVKSLLIPTFILLFVAIAGCSSDEKASEPKSNDSSKSSSELPIEEIEKRFNEKEFSKKYPDYQVNFEQESGMESVYITNHDPKDLANLPDYQELIEYGYVSLESDDMVYAIDIFLKDTESYYSAEYNAETKELITEDGDWTPEGDLEKFVSERLEMIDYVLQK